MNKSNKFTPGPWSVVSSKSVEPGPYFPIRVAGAHSDVARVSHGENARLIAAAPELLEAAQKLMRAIFKEAPECAARLNGANELLRLGEAIAKATGGAE